LKLVGKRTCSTLTFSSGGGTPAVRAAQRDELRIEGVPYACVGVTAPQGIGIDARNALEIRQRRHVHDRHARNPGLGDRNEQLAHAGRTVLRLLHGERDQIVVGGLTRPCARDILPGSFLRVDLDEPIAALDRHAHDRGLPC